MSSVSKIIIALSLIIFAGAGFFGGMKYQQSKQPSRSSFQSNNQLKGTGRQGMPEIQQRTGANAIRGEIISQDKESITIKLTDNSSKIVLISENTEINKATEGSTEDLKTGEQVMIFGKENSDGSVTAQSIQLNSGLGILKNQ